ncbi:MAG: valine--tRNA ligase [bacterium]|nr:valine--tRNA ligase [bacterium]
MMDKVYEPAIIEEKWLKYWEEEKLYSPTLLCPGRKNYSILLPPPNANASLHAGHGMFVVQDILIRYHRMLGENAVWIPGTDHAGFETQYVFEKQLAKEGKSRFQMNRKDLYDAVYKFVQDNSGVIEGQLTKLGFSLDWSRKTFTLDKDVVKTVYSTFEKMYKDDLIYRDNYIVNYCTHCGTSFSELEIEHKDRVDPLYYIQYGPFVVATVRTEPMFGDVAIAVNPTDERYQKYIGTTVEVDGILGKMSLPVIGDEEVDPAFGTGAMKVTPAHDPHDFALSRKHNLPVVQVIDFKGRLNEKTGEFEGLKVNEARKKIAERLRERDQVVKVDENYSHRISVCYKCGRDIEPMVLPNWFVKMKPLAEKAIAAAKNKDVVFYPERFEDEFYRWLEKIRDWPISRQIVWGIRIPAWYDIAKNPKLLVTFLNSTGETVYGSIDELMKSYSLEEIESGLQSLTAENASVFVIADDKPTDGASYLPETDTFDTWFSSGQWPLVTLGFPDAEDFKQLYPTSVMDTMWDILFFWVSRMIMFGIYLTGDVPFKTVLMHSRVVDEKGQKMSKSKGNVVNPLDLSAKYGTDAFRMSLIAGSALGNDVPMSDAKVKGYRNFTNKLWNSARFVIDFKSEDEKKTGKTYTGLELYPELYASNVFVSGESQTEIAIEKLAKSTEDREILEKLDVLIKLVKESLEKYRFSDAALGIYEFYWHEFCDKYIEYAKDKRETTQGVLEYVLKASTELLHPFMPFATEEVWQRLPHAGKSISVVE